MKDSARRAMFAKMQVRDFKADNISSSAKNQLISSILKDKEKNHKEIKVQTVMLYPVAFHTTMEDKKGKILAEVTAESKTNGKWEVWGKNVRG